VILSSTASRLGTVTTHADVFELVLISSNTGKSIAGHKELTAS